MNNHSYVITMMLNKVDEEEKLKAIVSHSGQARTMTFLTEDGLYEVLMQSRKPIKYHIKPKVSELKYKKNVLALSITFLYNYSIK